MWKDIKIDKVGVIEKCVAEFHVWSSQVLPYGKMKVKIFERQDGSFTGYTDVRIIRKFDNTPEAAVGFGKSIEEALTDTVNYFMQMVEMDYPKDEYPHGLSESDIEYTDYSDF